MENTNLKNLGSLPQWKLTNNVNKIEVLQGKGAMFAHTSAGTLLFSKKADLSKPLYVGENEMGTLFVYNMSSVETVATL